MALENAGTICNTAPVSAQQEKRMRFASPWFSLDFPLLRRCGAPQQDPPRHAASGRLTSHGFAV
jgi:hypothetical protein